MVALVAMTATIALLLGLVGDLGGQGDEDGSVELEDARRAGLARIAESVSILRSYHVDVSLGVRNRVA